MTLAKYCAFLDLSLMELMENLVNAEFYDRLSHPPPMSTPARGKQYKYMGTWMKEMKQYITILIELISSLAII